MNHKENPSSVRRQNIVSTFPFEEPTVGNTQHLQIHGGTHWLLAAKIEVEAKAQNA